MKRKEGIAVPAIGGSSLLTVFAVLCLTVFAMLSLSTVQAQKRLSEASTQAVTEYYAADLEAEKIFARLRSGEKVPDVREEGGIYAYACPISEHQTLYVELERNETLWRVLRWQATAHPQEVSETLPVWDGK